MSANARSRISPRTLAVAALSPLFVGLAVAWTSLPATASMPASAYDYCVIVHPVYVDNTQVFGGGKYCVPLP